MHGTKPQILPRSSLLKKNKSNTTNNITTKSNVPDSSLVNNDEKTIKPAIPAKPSIIAAKPLLKNISNDKVRERTTISNDTITTIVTNNSHHDEPSTIPDGQDAVKPIKPSTIVKNLPLKDDVHHNHQKQQQQQNKKHEPKDHNHQHHHQPIRKKLTKNHKPNSAKKSATKFRINSNDLNQLRFRKDFFDNKNLDSQANFIVYDVREDEEQINKMNEICELLVAGGYFRARIKGLHNFDKVIGGMCWAIQMCNVDLDIDIFYQENLSIGQKIALTEKIVRASQKMKCPFKLEPHQIQGMDCIHIFPAIQWLIKKSLETRQQTAQYIRSYSTWQFNRTYGFDDETLNSVIFNNDKLIDPIKANLQRRFIHPSRGKLKDETVRVNTTLLEYGIIYSGMNPITLNAKTAPKFKSIDDGQSNQDISRQKEKSPSEIESKLVENLLDSMQEMDEGKSGNSMRVPTSLVGKIVSEQSAEIKRLAEDYGKQRAMLSPEELEFAREEMKLKEEIQAKRRELAKLLLNKSSEKLSIIKEKLETIEAKSKELQNLEKNENETLKNEKLRLTEVLNVLRKQKSKFKQHCREEKQRLEQQIDMVKASQVDSEQLKDKLKEIDQELKTFETKHLNVKKDLSIANKKYAIIQRKFDDIPNRTELAQYQKRFLELYNQLLSKHNETKKFYTLFNTLSDERMYLEKEFNLINSVLENFQKASMSNLMVKDEFLVKLEQTVDTIMQNKNKVEQKLLSEKTKRDQLNADYGRLIEEQRLYFVAVKAFKEECKINEQLIVKLDKLKNN